MSDFIVLPIKGCDMVLGVQWLHSLGPIVWNFASLTMQFGYIGKSCTLQGIMPGSLHVYSGSQLSKCITISGMGPGPVLLTSTVQADLKLTGGEISQELEELLSEYADIFQLLKGLPSSWLQDHKIPLLDEGQVVKIRPYRYLVVQKNEIEKLVQEMFDAGIIRDSNSPFALPIVMVKKKDRSWRLCVDYRQLNQLTLKDKFPIPVIEELLDELRQAMYFSKLDLRSGYH